MFTLKLTEAQFKALAEAMDQFVTNTSEALEDTEDEGWADFRVKWKADLEAGEQILELVNQYRANR